MSARTLQIGSTSGGENPFQSNADLIEEIKWVSVGITRAWPQSSRNFFSILGAVGNPKG